MIRLINVYRSQKLAMPFLYRLLKEREQRVNISHRRMPSMKEHIRFVRSKPYKSWHLICDGIQAVGAVYLSRNDEIGLFILKEFQKKGYGAWALKSLMKKHRNVRRFFANVNPHNKRSIQFFCNNGFRHIQNTYEFNAKSGRGK